MPPTTFLITALMTTASAAQAALPPCAYDALMRKAEYVVLLGQTEIGAPDATGMCRIDGVVAAQFTSPDAPGGHIAVLFTCTNPQQLVGPNIYTDAAQLARYPYVEIHIAPQGGVAAYGAGIFGREALIDRPAWEYDATCGS